MGLFNHRFPSPKEIKRVVEEMAYKIAEDLAGKLLMDYSEEELRKALENNELGELTLWGAYTVSEKISDEADWLVSESTTDNILIAYAYSGEVKPIEIDDISADTIDEYAAFFAHEVWYELIFEKLEEILKKHLGIS